MGCTVVGNEAYRLFWRLAGVDKREIWRQQWRKPSLAIVILCVDDDHTALAVRRLLLSIKGYAVVTATSADAALRVFNCNHVDLVITDHLLPDGTGAHVTYQMKRLRPEVPIVLLTAWPNVPPGYEHADRLLSKCMAPEEFLAEIASLLSNRNENTRHSHVSIRSSLVA
jgi:DNA-binding response OmpR family regulator